MFSMMPLAADFTSTRPDMFLVPSVIQINVIAAAITNDRYSFPWNQTQLSFQKRNITKVLFSCKSNPGPRGDPRNRSVTPK